MIQIDDTSYTFEPLFLLAEPGSLERGASANALGSAALDSSKSVIDDSSSIYMQSSTLGRSREVGACNGAEHEQRSASLHCC